MPHVIDRLATLRVADIMTTLVHTVGKNQTMSEVAADLVRHDLSSAPVVDELGHCVGIITASDFVKREGQLQQATDDMLIREEGRAFRCVAVTGDYVGSHMTDAVQTIDADASLLKAARVMCSEHIHRLLVIDETHRPVGVISTMDIVAATVNVVDEMEQESSRTEG